MFHILIFAWLFTFRYEKTHFADYLIYNLTDINFMDNGPGIYFMKQPEKLFIAHRGESHDAPENTLAAVKLAWQRGAKAVEVDVHLTADNEICVIHDKNTLRTTGKKRVVSKSGIEELQKLDAGSWKGEVWAGERIPALKEVLATVPSHGKLIVEIKSDSKILVKLKQEIKSSGLQNNQVEIIAFHLQTLAKAKEMMPQIKMLWLFMSSPRWIQWFRGTSPEAVLKNLRKYNIDGVNIGDSRHLKTTIIKKYASAGYPLYVWTVNDPDRAFELAKSGVDCITTDRAGWMIEMLKNRALGKF